MGTVKDENGSGLAGVSIVEKGSARGVTTDGRGKFSIGLQKPTTLVFSYTGYDSQELLATPGAPVDISLKRDANALTDVVVVGYGTQRRKDVTGAVATVDIANVKDIPPTNPSKLLAGQVSGVLVKQPTGEPGRGMNINI
ncbi:MAG TPA: carboxypeptidase-like regulatory domain-containing protein, partial [Flavitalea sp.]|nr:carboxypeptidase-like regulatory domain-containing protein [Flavitalea sp.]